MGIFCFWKAALLHSLIWSRWTSQVISSNLGSTRVKWKQAQLWEPKSVRDWLLRTWETVSCIACMVVRWGPVFLAYCCLTAKGWRWGSLLQAPSWKDLSTCFLRFFTYPPLCLRIHSYEDSLVCCSHSGCEFGSVLRDHGFQLRWKMWKEVSFFWGLGIRLKGYGSSGRGFRVKYVSI